MGNQKNRKVPEVRVIFTPFKDEQQKQACYEAWSKAIASVIRKQHATAQGVSR